MTSLHLQHLFIHRNEKGVSRIKLMKNEKRIIPERERERERERREGERERGREGGVIK